MDHYSDALSTNQIKERLDNIAVLVGKVSCSIERGGLDYLIAADNIFSEDPAGAYEKMTADTKDIYCTITEDIASSTGSTTEQVAQACIALAEANVLEFGPGHHASHVGYYLCDSGQDALIGRLPGKCRNTKAYDNPGVRIALYTALLFGSSMLATVAVGFLFSINLAGDLTQIIFVVCGALLVMDGMANVVERQIGQFTGPRPSHCMEFTKSGIPDLCRTAIAVPFLLISKAQIDALISTIEYNHIVTNDTNVATYLLVDFRDSTEPEPNTSELELLDACVAAIRHLNTKYSTPSELFFHLLIRDRKYSRTQKAWIGYERKLGKIEAFNRAIRGDISGFSDRIPIHRGIFHNIRYVICIDDDTRLARNAVQYLVGTIDHPLNRPVVEPASRTLARGHALVVPSALTRNASLTKWRLPYVIAGSNFDELLSNPPLMRNFLYDFFAVAHYPGKGIYDVVSYQICCADRIPRECVLSHDTIEGAWLRPGFSDKAIVADSFPSDYFKLNSRQHRWIRGDFQNFWLLLTTTKMSNVKLNGSFPSITRFIIINQIRNAITPIFQVTLLITLMTQKVHPLDNIAASVVVAGLFPSYIRVARLSWSDMRFGLMQFPWRPALKYSYRIHVAHMFRIMTAPQQALIAADAILRTAWRVMSGRRLLEWTSAAAVESSRGHVFLYKSYAFVVSIASLATLAMLSLNDEASLVDTIILSLWIASPWLIAHTSKPGVDID